MKKVIQRDEPAGGANSLGLRTMEREVERRGGEMDVAAVRSTDGDVPADALRMQVALMMGAWQSELSSRIDGVMRQIERNGEPDEHWELLRRQIETAQPEIGRYVTASISTLTKMESKIFLLIGMSIPQHEIAEILNISAGSVSAHRTKIYRKLDLSPDIRLDELFGAMLR